ncbi:MAG: hypothetical protein HKO03_09385 [Acidimicrobiia bacterium]|nr:hypothetical protein [Acidimicrobiia bacterium]
MELPKYDDEIGWVRVDGLITPELAASIAASCDAVADGLTDPRSGDKPHGATRVVRGSHRRVDQQRLSQKVDHLEGEEYMVGGAGTAFVFSRHLLHAGSANHSGAPRPALQISYLTYRPDGTEIY